MISVVYFGGQWCYTHLYVALWVEQYSTTDLNKFFKKGTFKATNHKQSRNYCIKTAQDTDKTGAQHRQIPG